MQYCRFKIPRTQIHLMNNLFHNSPHWVSQEMKAWPSHPASLAMLVQSHRSHQHLCFLIRLLLQIPPLQRTQSFCTWCCDLFWSSTSTYTAGIGSKSVRLTSMWFTVIIEDKVEFVIRALHAVLIAFIFENPLSTTADDGERVTMILINIRTHCSSGRFSASSSHDEFMGLYLAFIHHNSLQAGPFLRNLHLLIITKNWREELC